MINQAHIKFLHELLGVDGIYMHSIRNDHTVRSGIKILYLRRALRHDCYSFLPLLDKLYIPENTTASIPGNIELVRALKWINDLYHNNEVKFGEHGLRHALPHYFKGLGEISRHDQLELQRHIDDLVNKEIANLLAKTPDAQNISTERIKDERTIIAKPEWRTVLDLPQSQLNPEQRAILPRSPDSQNHTSPDEVPTQIIAGPNPDTVHFEEEVTSNEDEVEEEEDEQSSYSDPDGQTDSAAGETDSDNAPPPLEPPYPLTMREDIDDEPYSPTQTQSPHDTDADDDASPPPREPSPTREVDIDLTTFPFIISLLDQGTISYPFIGRLYAEQLQLIESAASLISENQIDVQHALRLNQQQLNRLHASLPLLTYEVLSIEQVLDLNAREFMNITHAGIMGLLLEERISMRTAIALNHCQLNNVLLMQPFISQEMMTVEAAIDLTPEQTYCFAQERISEAVLNRDLPMDEALQFTREEVDSFVEQGSMGMRMG